MTVARKVESNSLADRLRARYVLVVKTMFWLVTSVVKKQRRLIPGPVERLARRALRAIQ